MPSAITVPGVVPRVGEDGGGRGGQVLAGLELHCDCGIGRSSSRARAAPYAAAACTPAAVIVGYSAVIWPTVIWPAAMPTARQPGMTLTGTRVSATTTWPCVTCGSAEIIWSCSLVTITVCPANGGNAEPGAVSARQEVPSGGSSNLIVSVDLDAPVPPFEQIRSQIAAMAASGTLLLRPWLTAGAGAEPLRARLRHLTFSARQTWATGPSYAALMQPARSTATGQGARGATLAAGLWLVLAAGWALLGTAACATTFVISTIPAPPPWGRAYTTPFWLQATELLLALIMIPACAAIPVPLLVLARRRIAAARTSPFWLRAWTAAASAAVLVEAVFLYRLALMLRPFQNLPTRDWHALAFAIAYAVAGLVIILVLIAARQSSKAARERGHGTPGTA